LIPLDFKTAPKNTHQLQQNENPGKPYETTTKIWGYQTNVSKKNHPKSIVFNRCFIWICEFGILRHDLVFQVLNQIVLNVRLLLNYAS